MMSGARRYGAAVSDAGAQRTDVLSSPGAGRLAIRGGTARVAGYAAGIVLSLISAPLLIRHLGVAEFGGYVSVMALVTVVGLVADMGLTVVAVREYANLDDEGRARLMGSVLGLRLAVAVAGAAVAVGIAAAAGYDDALVVGTALAGAGLVLTMAQQTFTVPLAAGLRLGRVTLLELLTKVLTVVGIVVLVLADADVKAFLAIAIPVGAVVAVATFVVAGERVRPSARGWRALVAAALPVAVASILAALFYRLAVLLTSFISTERELGYFAASFRVIEVLLPIPSLLTATAFPVLARAAQEGGDRLVSALRRVFDISMVCGGAAALGLVAGAQPVMRFLGGREFDPSIAVLRVQGIAMAASFLFATAAVGLLALRAQRELVAATVIGTVAVTALTLLLVPPGGAMGAALAMTVSEAVLAGSALVLLARRQRLLRPAPATAVKVAVAFAAGLAPWATGLPDLPATAAGLMLYAAVVVALRAVPRDVAAALRRGEIGA